MNCYIKKNIKVLKWLRAKVVSLQLLKRKWIVNVTCEFIDKMFKVSIYKGYH